jgi:hypothetical protein
LGLTSPVAAQIGKFAIDREGKVLLSPEHILFLAGDPALGGKGEIPYADFTLAVQRFIDRQ